MRCPGSVALEAQCPDTSSAFADEGTAAHELAAMALEARNDTAAYLGRVIKVGEREFTVGDEMAANVQTYIDTVRSFAQAPGAELLVEQRVEFSEQIGVPESFGTSDAVILVGDELQVHDLKYGKGVKVDAEENEQLMLYAIGALNEFGMVADFERVRMVIHQPRLGHVSEWACTTLELAAFAGQARQRAEHAINCIRIELDEAEDLKPGEKQCRFCKAKATCPALAQKVVDEFTTLPEEEIKTVEADALAAGMAQVELIESWCKAVRAEAERRLLAGQDVPGFKLVEGRRGARRWANEKDVETTLKGMRLKHEQMFDYSLISPTTAEKLHKAEVLGPRQWATLQELITQAEGKPSVAPASDKRPALQVTPVADEFESLV
jgi:hypothetical protein